MEKRNWNARKEIRKGGRHLIGELPGVQELETVIRQMLWHTVVRESGNMRRYYTASECKYESPVNAQ